MPTPVWQPGTIYAPGSLVQPASAPPPQPDEVTNGGFESGNTGWTLDTGYTIGEFGNGTHFQGTWSLQWDLTGTGLAINNNATQVTPGQSITASCQVQQGASSSGQAGARVQILWYDSSDDFLSSSEGNMVDSTSSQNWKQSTVTGIAPAGAAFARFAVYSFRTSGGDELWVDNCTWNAVVSGLPSGLVFRAVQATAGYSAASEPVWPLVEGQTVVDNEVTWEAVFASRVVWEAAPVLVSGAYEPEWPTVPNGEVADGTIRWVAMNWRVTDPKCPQGPVVAIAASKIFNADDDIIAFSATTNPLDWSAEEDAGFIPFGLQTYGATPVTAMGLYRSNLVAFNSEGFQMWQIDEDPANMAILDASPVPCLFPKSVQPVSNDLVMCTPEGVRNIGIAGASTNLQAGYFGAQVDPLVIAKIRAGEAPIALFWPAMGQYWLIFGDEAFVLTMNGGTKDQSWSRYVFPGEITDWANLNGDLYLRAGDLIWRVDPELLVDDYQSTPETGGTINFIADQLPIGSSAAGVSTIVFGGQPVAGTLTSGALAGYTSLQLFWAGDTGGELRVRLQVPDADVRTTPQTAFFTGLNIEDVTDETITAASATFTQSSSGGLTTYTWLWFSSSLVGAIVDGESYTAVFTPDGGGETGEPFEGYLAWPYLDFGVLGMDKMMEGFDIVATGEFSVSIGYSQRNTSLATEAYTLDGDTVTGSMVPMPLTAPSFQFRITFSAEQAWEWFATNMYCNNLGTG